MPGRVLRAKLVGLVRPSAAPDAGLADRVAFELSHAPRTWHLPQPAVTVDEAAGVTLRGTVPHEDAREHLVAAARAVPGVDHVHDDLVVEAPDSVVVGASDWLVVVVPDSVVVGVADSVVVGVVGVGSA